MKEATTNYRTDALVVKEMIVGESDRLVTLFTRDLGLIKAFASGAKGIKSKKSAATGLLTYSNFFLVKKKDTYKIKEAAPIKSFFGAGSDIVSLALSQYLCELCLVLAPSGVASEEFLRLILNSLNFIAEKKFAPDFIKAITELRTAVISGYMPNLVACSKCGCFENDVMYFLLDDGSLICGDCGSNVGIPINRTVMTAMRHIVYSEFKNLYSFSIPENDVTLLSSVAEKYITYQTEHKFATLDFYKTVI